jgi:hypothetical protein
MKPTWDNWEWILLNKDASRDSQPGTLYYQFKWIDEARNWESLPYRTDGIPPITWAWDRHDIEEKGGELSIDVRLNNYYFYKSFWSPSEGDWDNDDELDDFWKTVQYPN